MNRDFTVIARLRNAKWEILPSPHVRFKHLQVFLYRAALLKILLSILLSLFDRQAVTVTSIYLSELELAAKKIRW